MTADVQRELAEALRENLAHQHGCDTLLSSFICNRCAQSVRALLPTVQALIADAERRAAAQALRDAAADWAADPDAVGDSEKDARNWLRDRADALDPT